MQLDWSNVNMPNMDIKIIKIRIFKGFAVVAMEAFRKKIHNFLLIDQSECYILFVSILIGQYGQ